MKSLSEAQVLAIREGLSGEGVSLTQLASDWGVTNEQLLEVAKDYSFPRISRGKWFIHLVRCLIPGEVYRPDETDLQRMQRFEFKGYSSVDRIGWQATTGALHTHFKITKHELLGGIFLSPDPSPGLIGFKPVVWFGFPFNRPVEAYPGNTLRVTYSPPGYSSALDVRTIGGKFDR